jgi:hypothetical protein
MAAYVRKGICDLFRTQAPKPDVSQSRCVHHEPSVRAGVHLRCHGRMTTGVAPGADLGGAEAQSRDEPVQETRLPDARGTSEKGDPTLQEFS